MDLDNENLPPNYRLGHYVITSRLAVGGMGVVYKAFEEKLERYVAIKVLRAEFAKNPIFVRYFVDEARAVGGLNHPNIVPIYYIGEEEGCIFFSMGFIQGETFDDWIFRGSLFTDKDASWFMMQAVPALECAHQSNIIHLDIKPSNFLINSKRNVFLTDFGLAERLTQQQTGQEVEKGFGTPHYAAPEQFLRDRTDHRTDIYSLGATLFHLMVGSPAYDGANSVEIARAHLYQPFPSQEAERAGVPQSWIQLMSVMMEKDPAKRYADYEELYGEIEGLRNNQITRSLGIVSASASVLVVTEANSTNSLPVREDQKAQLLMQRDAEPMVALASRLEGKALARRPDGVILSFGNPVNAVHWALTIQEQFLLSNYPPEHRLWHRVSIHYGDYVMRGDDVTSDSITTTYRLQEKVYPGEICISSTVINMLPTRAGLDSSDLGEFPANGTLIRVYKIARMPAGPADAVQPEPKKEIQQPKPVDGSWVVLLNIGLIILLLIFLLAIGPIAYYYFAGSVKLMSLINLFFPKQ